MPKVSPLQGNFNGGEFSPLVYGRVDTERYKTGLGTCLNYIPCIQGGLTRRPGTQFVAEVRASDYTTRLVPFEFSTTQAYILEFSSGWIRFYKDNAQITLDAQNITGVTAASPAVVTYSGSDTYANGDEVFITGIAGDMGTRLNNRNFRVASVNAAANTFALTDLAGNNVSTVGLTYTSGGTVAEIYEIASPYTYEEVFDLSFVQSADTLYICHPNYAPRSLTRTAHTSWTLSTPTILDGPYLSTNSTTTTLTPSAATGTGITLTASAVTGINNNTGFQTTDVGRKIRMKQGSTWGWAIITGRTSTTVVTISIIETLGTTDPKTEWRLGAWSETTGYPSCVVFHEDRLFFAGIRDYPLRLDGSNSGDYLNFAPSDLDSTISASNAVSFSLNADGVNAIKWLTSDEKGLLAGTVAGEWCVRPSSQNEALSPTNITAKRATSFGSAGIQAVQVGKTSIFVQRASRKVRELTYFYEVDGFQAPDLTVISEHITGTGLVQMAYQREPQSILWAVREDGVLVGMTYERDLDGLKVAWHRHIIGGYSDAANSDAVVESCAVIPSADGTRDELWLIVRRRINGRSVRYVEYVTKLFEDTDDQQDAFFVDCGLTYDNPLTITGATNANPVVITSTAHGLSNGDTVRITDIVGMTELNGNSYKVANVAANTFELTNSNGTNINGTSYGTYVSGGEVRKKVSSVTGLWHLEGQTVQVCGDGATQPDVTISNGTATLTTAAAVVHLGFGYNSDGQLLRLEAGSADGTSLGKKRRTHQVGFLVHRSLGLKIGTSFDDLTELTFRTASDALGQAPALYSGIVDETLEADYDFENQVCWRAHKPLPSTILAVMPRMVTYDK